REQVEAYKKKKEEETARREKDWQDQLAKKETDYARQLLQEKQQVRQQLEETLRKTISADFENKLHILEQSNKESDEKLKTARQKELEFLQKEQSLQNREAELELDVQRRLQEERGKLQEE